MYIVESGRKVGSFFFFSSRRRHTRSVSAFLLNRSSDLIFAAEGLTKRSAVGFLLRSLIMFQTFISRHNSNFFSDKLVLTSVTPASSAPVLQTPKATSSTLYFEDRKSGSAGMPRPISYAVFCLKKKKNSKTD